MPDDDSRLLQILTTEHFGLQGARGTATAESSSRCTLYLTVLSGATLALSFVSQVGSRPDLLPAFALLALPVVFFLGAVTYIRVLQTAIEDYLYQRGINRIRHAYTELAPRASHYLLSIYDDDEGVRQSQGLPRSRWQGLFTMYTMIYVINSIVGGVCAGIGLGMHQSTTWAIGTASVGTTVLSIMAFSRHQARLWKRAEPYMSVRFPSPADVK